ncbi:MAG: hypothetical protein HFJ53_05435 [Clostridia bacterium]|nr:hypothetical protein [Clostridia bacterium]
MSKSKIIEAGITFIKTIVNRNKGIAEIEDKEQLKKAIKIEIEKLSSNKQNNKLYDQLKEILKEFDTIYDEFYNNYTNKPGLSREVIQSSLKLSREIEGLKGKITELQNFTNRGISPIKKIKKPIKLIPINRDYENENEHEMKSGLDR